MVASHRARSIGAALRGVVAFGLLAGLVAGVPWALLSYVGRPFPDRLPTWVELQLQLFGPLSTGLLIDVLACACWVVWAVFTLDVVRCVPEAVRDVTQGVLRPRARRLSPTYAVAAALVGAVALSILGHRAPARTPRPSPSLVVAAAPAWSSGPASVVIAAHHGPLHGVDRLPPATPDPAARRSVVVRAPDPVTGVHDSLWRIADRTLGAGVRWPEIFEVNRGKPQPGGGHLTRPSLIFPGEELILPAPAGAAAKPGDPMVRKAPVTDQPTHHPRQLPSHDSTSPGATLPGSPVGRNPSGTAMPSSRGPTVVDGIDTSLWRPDVFAGIGLAAAVSAALLAARRRRRRHYRPGSNQRADLPEAPVVYQLRLAHLRKCARDGSDDLDDFDERADLHGLDDERATGVNGPDGRDSPPDEANVGPDVDPAADARAIAAAAASVHGLGLTGPGAGAALRAILLTFLGADAADAEHQPRIQVIGPRGDLAELLGVDLAHRRPGRRRPSALRVLDTLDDVLDELETAVLDRATAPDESSGVPLLVLVARPVEHAAARVQAVLDNGSTLGVAGLLMGQWRPGSSLHVRPDGTVTATSPGPCEALRGARLFGVDAGSVPCIMELLGDHTTAAYDDPGPMSGDDYLEVVAVRAAGDGSPADSDAAQFDEPSVGDLDGPAAGSGDLDEGPRAAVPLRIRVLGPPAVLWRPESGLPGGAVTEVEITGKLQPRTRELLVYLALHPGGVGREALAAALWPGSPPGRVTNALNTALTRLRQTLTRLTDGEVGDVAVNADGRLALDPAVVEVDYWLFDSAVSTRRSATTDAARLTAHQLVVDHYGGELAEGMGLEWIEPARESVRRDAIDSVAALARALFTTDPQRTLELLEIARAFDPYNELLYRDIMRLQERLGRVDAIPRTLALLTARLAETGDPPTPETTDLARRLKQRGDPPANASPHARPENAETRNTRGVRTR